VALAPISPRSMAASTTASRVGHLAGRLEPLRRRQTRETARQLGPELVKVGHGARLRRVR
jgi:hypothetical protein